jgi:hypothetical protein
MEILNLVGLAFVALPVFFIIKTSVGMIKDKRLN